MSQILNRAYIVRTLIYQATKGKNNVIINFDINYPYDVFRHMILNIIASDLRLVGVKFDVLNNTTNTVHFSW